MACLRKFSLEFKWQVVWIFLRRGWESINERVPRLGADERRRIAGVARTDLSLTVLGWARSSHAGGSDGDVYCLDSAGRPNRFANSFCFTPSWLINASKPWSLITRSN